MENNIKNAAEAVRRMDEHLRNDIMKDKEGWGNTAQLDKRRQGGVFTLSDHIRGMVLAMLSSNRPWEPIEENMGKIDKIFFDYDAKKIMAESPDNLVANITNIKCGNKRIKFQMEALKGNIEKLIKFETESGSIDEYYKKLNKNDISFITLVKLLSGNKETKLNELGEALVCEYLRHLGYDLPKPDRHILRIFGNKMLACSEKEEAGIWEVFDIIAKIAKEIGKSSAEVDYILWSYCTKICTIKKDPKCSECVAKEFCKK